MRFTREDVRVGLVLEKTGEHIVLKIPRSDQYTFQLKGGEAFLTLLFIRSDGEGGIEVWDPWEGF